MGYPLLPWSHISSGRTDERTLIVGCDVHQNTIRICLLDQASDNRVVPPFTVPNDRFGAEQAIQTLHQTLSTHAYTHLVVGMEATSFFWLPFYRAIEQSPLLSPFHPRLVLFNPKLVAHFRKGLDLRTEKTDDHDARAIAERLRFGHLPTATVPDDFWQALRRLTRYRYHLIHDLVREKLRFLSYLFLKLSAWQQVRPTSDPLGAASIALLTEFTAEDLAQMPLTALADLIAQRGRHAFDDLVATARRVQEVLRRSYPVASELDEATTFSLAAMRDHIHFLERLLRRLDQEIARRIEKVPNPLLTVVGLGPVISAGILAEIGDIQRFPGHPPLAAYAGLAWKRSQSGSFAAEDTRLVSVGNRYLRLAEVPGDASA
ncbi:MAG: IS110 family transposase [Thermoflexia bacterium]|nr:MAG: IS110 family transposase [Thermoflexia bacterium]